MKTKEGASPLELTRRSLGLTRGQMALVSGVSHGSIFNAERGAAGQAAIPGRVITALEGLGVDVDVLAREQAAWLRTRAAEVRDEVLARAKPVEAALPR